jgi:hypothetical protein
MFVQVGEVAVDGNFEICDAFESAASDALSSYFGKEPFDEVQPGTRCRRKVE